MMTIKEYTDICIKFAADTADWGGYDDYRFYTTDGHFDWTESCDNAHGGLHVDWAFHMDADRIRELAPQEFLDDFTNLLCDLVDDKDVSREDLCKFIENYGE